MNYEYMRDFEIEQRVSVVINGDNLVRKAPYCSSPEWAWPIIVENKIGVMPAIVRSQRDKGVWIASTDWSRLSAFDSRSDNPLRAAMICFLKMKDAEK